MPHCDACFPAANQTVRAWGAAWKARVCVCVCRCFHVSVCVLLQLCGECKQPITGTALTVKGVHKTFHPECFRCGARCASPPLARTSLLQVLQVRPAHLRSVPAAPARLPVRNMPHRRACARSCRCVAASCQREASAYFHAQPPGLQAPRPRHRPRPPGQQHLRQRQSPRQHPLPLRLPTRVRSAPLLGAGKPSSVPVWQKRTGRVRRGARPRVCRVRSALSRIAPKPPGNYSCFTGYSDRGHSDVGHNVFGQEVCHRAHMALAQAVLASEGTCHGLRTDSKRAGSEGCGHANVRVRT